MLSELIGSTTLCSNSTQTYSIENSPPNTIVTWETSDNLHVITSNNTNITVEPLTPSTKGEAYIEAILPTYIARKDFWIGTAYVKIIKENYDPSYPIAYDVAIENADKQFISNVVWEKVSGQGTISQNENIISAHVGGGTNPWTLNAKATVTNPCGVIIKYFSVSGGGNPPCVTNFIYLKESEEEYILNLNPCEDELNQREFNINTTVFDIYGNIMFKTTSKRINISNIKSGIYIIKTEINNETITKKIIK